MKAKLFRKQCPVCKRWITAPGDYIHSYRLQPSGEYRLIELCRKCRDEELTQDGQDIPATSPVTVWYEGDQPWKH